ncbi:MAG: roadblock/LC7 domain-containing protein [Candidatus Atabeyarchaeum deiterrae]
MDVPVDVEKIRFALKEITGRTAEIEGAALVSYDGMMIANALHGDSSQDVVAAITATLLNLGKLSADVLQLGGVEQVFVKCTDGYIVIGRVGDHSAITLLARREAKIGILISELGRAAEAILEVEKERGKEEEKERVPAKKPTKK